MRTIGDGLRVPLIDCERFPGEIPRVPVVLTNSEQDSRRAVHGLVDPRSHEETIVESDAGLIATGAHVRVWQEGGRRFGCRPAIGPERSPRQVLDHLCG